jgi:hypothetical protein
VDASENGDGVFIASRTKLVPQDEDEGVNLYDVRVDGARPLSEVECSGTGCQGVPPAPPIFATPASVTFNGPGDFPAPAPEVKKVTKKTVKCAKGKYLSHDKCVKSKSRHKKANKARRASRNRRDK